MTNVLHSTHRHTPSHRVRSASNWTWFCNKGLFAQTGHAIQFVLRRNTQLRRRVQANPEVPCKPPSRLVESSSPGIFVGEAARQRVRLKANDLIQPLLPGMAKYVRANGTNTQLMPSRPAVIGRNVYRGTTLLSPNASEEMCGSDQIRMWILMEVRIPGQLRWVGRPARFFAAGVLRWQKLLPAPVRLCVSRAVSCLRVRCITDLQNRNSSRRP